MFFSIKAFRVTGRVAASGAFDYRIPRMTQRYCAPVLFILISISVIGCAGDEELTLPPRRALSDGPYYAVAQPAYVRVQEEPAKDSGVVGHMRRGDIGEILSESEFTDIHDNQAFRWYEVDADGGVGWVFGQHVSLHELYRQAERMSRRLIESQRSEERFQ